MKWWNNGIVCTRSKECPEGFVPGRLNFKSEFSKGKKVPHTKWWNNGIVCTRSKECPEGFVPGRLNFTHAALSVETKLKISAANKGKCSWNKGIKVGPDSEITKQRKRDSALKRDNSVYVGRKSWMKGINSDDSRVEAIFNKQRGQRRKGNYERGKRHHAYNAKRSDFLRYRQKVTLLSEKNYVLYFGEINPNNYPRCLAGVEGGYHLDHVKSVYQCWKEEISPEQCAAPSNLRMLPWIENVKKGCK